MDSGELPVAKRTRLGFDKILHETLRKERARKCRTSGAGAAGPEIKVEHVDLVSDEDDGPSVVKKGESSKSRRFEGGFKKGEKREKECHSSEDDVVEMSCVDVNKAVDKFLSEEESDSDIRVISVVDIGEENADERMVDGGDDGTDNDQDDEEDVALDAKGDDLSHKTTSSEDDSFYDDESDESYREDRKESRSDHDESLDDSSSCDDDDEQEEVRCKGKGRIVESGRRGSKKVKRRQEDFEHRGKRKVDFEFTESNSNNDEVRCRVWEKKDVECNGKVRMAESGKGGSRNDKRKKEDHECRGKRKGVSFEFGESNSDDDVRHRICESFVEKCYREKVNSSQDRQCGPKPEVVEIYSSSENDNESQVNYVKRDGRERQKNLKMAAKRKLDFLEILADSLDGDGEVVEEAEKEKPQHKFWFRDEDEKPVEKSDFDKHVDELFKELNMCLTFEEIGSTPPETDRSSEHMKVDNDDHCKTETDQATLCSQGIHHLVLDEQIGIICKCCSHVRQEIKHILPTFSKPSPQTRRRGYFEQSGCPIYSDDFEYTDARRHNSEIYNITGTVWDLVPGTRSSMYEHQREGFEFIWKNLAGGIYIEKLEKPLSSSGSGCIISHAPGTGKTRLTIIFLQSFMKLYPDSRPVIIAPKSMLLTWEEEFKKWNINMPFHNLNNPEFSGQENPAAVSFSRKGRDSRNNVLFTRVVKLLSWIRDKSILGITYKLFDKLVSEATQTVGCTPIQRKMGKALLKHPSLLVLDEGHTPRNDQSSIYKSLLAVKTQRRIILSGTPFQNNFDELYNTLRLVNPKFDGEMKKSLRNISKEVQNKLSAHKLGELKVMISPFVHVHKGKILQKSCPGLKDALIHLQPTDLQQELIGVLSTDDMKARNLEWSNVATLVSVHPSLLPERYFEEHQLSTYKDKLKKLETDPFSGAKTKFVVEICRLSEALDEKVLIYSEILDPLVFIKKQLQTYFGWTEGKEVLYMYGDLQAKQRQTIISSVNDPRSKVRVLLASTKACSEGINLVGASRVVLLDVVWNPSVERQAISRAYRIGQKKIVYTYHLIGQEMDNRKYKAQTAKDRLSEIVFSSDDKDSCKENVPKMVSEDEILQKMIQHNDKLGGLIKQIVYQPKDSNLIDTYDLVAE
ncbi:hypothetical protein ACET3Z_002512 [Daucus carota]